MCRAANDVGGPRRCSGDARAILGQSQSALDHLQARHRRLNQILTDSAATPAPRRATALSASRAAEFKQCPQLFRFRAIDRIPEDPSPAALRGTLVHAVLERLHQLPPADRTPETARALLDPAWQHLQATEPIAATYSPEQVSAVHAEAAAMIGRYYTIEDPTRFTAAATESRFDVELDDGTPLRGIIDRIDIAATGQVRVVDYKTGKTPSQEFEASALFQMKFYALALLRGRGVLPAQLRLVYLGDGQVLDFTPSRAEIERFGKSLSALWKAIQTASAADDFPPRPSRFCGTCAHKVRCPAFIPPAG